MLRLSKVRAGGHTYYLEVTPGSGTGVEPPGEWRGGGGTALGLGGPVDADALGAVLAGSDPQGTVLSPAANRVRVVAFDLTFCAPKSVSILHGLGAPDVARCVEAAHRAAVDGALGYVERRAAAVRRVVDERRIPVAVDGLVAAAFRHGTSRALDPHLHSHVLVANLGRGVDGPWSALDGRGLYAHRAAADALYHAQLRHELTARLGVRWGPLDRGRADVAGIDEDARSEFSRRAAAIAAQVRCWDGRSSAAVELAAVTTRADKDPSLGPDQLRPEWRRRARRVGLDPRRLDAALGRAAGRSAGSEGEPGLRATEADEVLTRLAEGRAAAGAVAGDAVPGAAGADGGAVRRGGVTSRRHVVRQWCLSLSEGAPVAAVEAAADRLIATLEVDLGEGGRSRGDGPGVAERRYRVMMPERGAEGPDVVAAGERAQRAATEQDELERLLHSRGMRLVRDLPRGLERDDLGLGRG